VILEASCASAAPQLVDIASSAAQYSSIDEASLFNPFHPASRRSMSVNALAALTGLKHYSAFIFVPFAIFVNVATSSRISFRSATGTKRARSHAPLRSMPWPPAKPAATSHTHRRDRATP